VYFVINRLSLNLPALALTPYLRIRHYGFLAGCCRKQRLAQIREALAVEQETTGEADPNREGQERTYHYPVCKDRLLQMVAELPQQWRWNRAMRRR
jgi:hypothetical protein